MNNLDAEAPWGSPLEYIEAMAAFSSIHRSELSRVTHVNRQKLRQLLFNATAPHRMQWYFNNLRYRHSISSDHLALLGGGTAVNETIHRDLNFYFRNQGEWFWTTAELQLFANVLSKLLAHNTALYSPTLKQICSANILSMRAMTLECTDDEWTEFCSLLHRPGCDFMDKAALPLFSRRQHIAQIIKKHASDIKKRPSQGKSSVLRRPACHILKRPASKSRKRTVFTLKRVR